jgi:hypothetical protein
MRTQIRLKLGMATRARDFCRAHPDPNERYTATVGRLESQLTRAEAMATQQDAGQAAVHASTARRAELRRVLREQPLRHLARIADAASVSDPGLGARFKLPAGNISHQAFLVRARAMAAEAVTHRELFIGFGLPESFLDDLTAALNTYGQAVTDANAATSARVGARADLEAVTTDIMHLVQELDAMHRYRFRDNAELLAAWESARNVAWPTSNGTATPPTGEGLEPAA